MPDGNRIILRPKRSVILKKIITGNVLNYGRDGLKFAETISALLFKYYNYFKAFAVCSGLNALDNDASMTASYPIIRATTTSWVSKKVKSPFIL